MNNGTLILIISIIALFLVYRIIANNNIQQDFQLNEMNQEIININKLTLEMLEQENIKTTTEKFEQIKSIGLDICSGNELIYYGSGFDKETYQYKTICYKKYPLEFKYFDLNKLLGVEINETKN